MKTIVNLNSAQKRLACENITKELPDWFGIEESNIQYAKDAEKYDAILIKDNGIDVALLIYKKVFDEVLSQNVIDIHWLGILPAYHRKGLGRKLINTLKRLTESDIFTLETLDPAVKNESYLKTFAFYESLGFKVYNHFSYDNGCKMVKMLLKN